MKKEGFTLVELLAVIVIIGIIYLIVFPSVTSFIDKSKEKSYNIQVDLIEKASKKWVVDNTDELLKKDPYHLNNINLTLTTLKKDGYLQDEFIENPKTKKIMTGCVVVSYQSNKNQYEYTYEDGKDTYSKDDTKENKRAEEMAGCNNKKGYIYTYLSNNNTLEKTGGNKNSEGEDITLDKIFTDTLISKKDSGLVNLGNEYFFQGLNPTNYVKIDGYDTIWNVLSINTSDKTIKLVASAKTINSTFLASSSFNANSYESSSDLKTTLESKINELSSNIIKNDVNFNVGGITDISKGYDIISSEESNNIFTGKIGIITASEYLKTKNENGNTYLSPTNSGTVWTMNFSNNNHVIINTDGNLSTAPIDANSRFVYPTIVINANVIKKSGTGTSTDPYVISDMGA
jgi:prepilin-type N-terminal cleavage/methylation domain-containing protein